MVSRLDVSDLDETQQMLQLGEGMAPVAGVFHLAMVLTDKWIANQVSRLLRAPPAELPLPSTAFSSLFLSADSYLLLATHCHPA